jgi:trimethylamine:corrinoid methyltransferase-like protein
MIPNPLMLGYKEGFMSIENSQNEESQGPTRVGGRATRRSVRSAPLDAALRPIRPGMRGENFNPLD